MRVAVAVAMLVAVTTGACSLMAVPSRRRSAGQLRAHRVDRRRGSRRAEDRAAGDEGVGAGVGDGADVVDLDAAVDLEADVAPARVDAPARVPIFLSADGMNSVRRSRD